MPTINSFFSLLHEQKSINLYRSILFLLNDFSSKLVFKQNDHRERIFNSQEKSNNLLFERNLSFFFSPLMLINTHTHMAALRLFKDNLDIQERFKTNNLHKENSTH